MCERIQVISRLKLLAGTNPELFKISEIEADGLMKSDESELKDQIREELKKARLLLRKKFPLRYYLKVLKALWPK